jgi:hypothetical protein
MTLIIFGVKLLWGAMKASRQQAGENRARVLRVAARRFREGGIAGVSVADVMHEAARVLQTPLRSRTSSPRLALGFSENLEAYKQLGARSRRNAVKGIATGMFVGRCTVIFRRRVASWLP